MSLRILGSQGASLPSRGVTVEIGINCRRFIVRYFTEVDVRIQNKVGQTQFRSVDDKFSREVSLDGEITQAGIGIMAFTMGLALTFGNVTTTFGPCAGSFILDEAVTTIDRSGWRMVAVRASSNPLL